MAAAGYVYLHVRGWIRPRSHLEYFAARSVHCDIGRVCGNILVQLAIADDTDIDERRAQIRALTLDMRAFDPEPDRLFVSVYMHSRAFRDWVDSLHMVKESVELAVGRQIGHQWIVARAILEPHPWIMDMMQVYGAM